MQWISHLAARLSYLNCCLKYNRAESESWKDHEYCDDCVERHMIVWNPHLSCRLDDECACKLCRHQPPSLADSARHVLFNYTLHLDRFILTDEDIPTICICCSFESSDVG